MSITCGKDLQELFVADNENNAVRVFNIRTHQLFEKDIFKVGINEQISALAFCSASDSLFIATRKITSSYFVLHLMTRGVEMNTWPHSYKMNLEADQFSAISLSTLNDKSLLIGFSGSDTLKVYKLRHNPPIELFKTLKFPHKFKHFAAKIASGEYFVALSLCENHLVSGVTLFQVIGSETHQLSRIHFENPGPIFWRGDSVLVEVMARGTAQRNSRTIVELRREGTGLVSKGTILRDVQEGARGAEKNWCLYDDSLILYSNNRRELLLYTIYLHA